MTYMKLLFATSIKYPSPFANRIQTGEMAKAFARVLGDGFYFGGRNLPPDAGAMNLLRIEGSKRSAIFAWRYLTAIRRAGITHVYCREKRLLFFMVLYYRIFFRSMPLKFFYEEHAKPERTLWYRYFITRIDGVVALASIIAKELEELGAGHVAVIPHGVDIRMFDIALSRTEARERLALPDGPLAGYIGSFKTMGSVEKGMTTLLAALPLLDRAGIAFVSVGGSEDEAAAFERRAGEAGVGRARFIPRVERHLVPVYQKAFDVLILPVPANEYRYMLPLKVFEYMASGTPILASDVPSVRDILTEENAVLVPPDAPAALADAVEKLLKEPERARALASKARRDVEGCSWTARAERVLAHSIAV